MQLCGLLPQIEGILPVLIGLGFRSVFRRGARSDSAVGAPGGKGAPLQLQGIGRGCLHCRR